MLPQGSLDPPPHGSNPGETILRWLRILSDLISPNCAASFLGTLRPETPPVFVRHTPRCRARCRRAGFGGNALEGALSPTGVSEAVFPYANSEWALFW